MYHNRKVTVRFTADEFARYGQLLNDTTVLTWGSRTWSKLIRFALKELYEKHATERKKAQTFLSYVNRRSAKK